MHLQMLVFCLTFGVHFKLHNKYEIDINIIEESFAKQYLKMICSCIYKKVDETDNDKKKEHINLFGL